MERYLYKVTCKNFSENHSMFIFACDEREALTIFLKEYTFGIDKLEVKYIVSENDIKKSL